MNDFWWKWPNRAACADIVARTYRLAVIFFELAQRMDGNVTRLPMVIRVLDHDTPHAMEERMYTSQRSDIRARLVGFEASAASLRSRVNSGHCACALA